MLLLFILSGVICSSYYIGYKAGELKSVNYTDLFLTFICGIPILALTIIILTESLIFKKDV
jgi:hypothetical protein